jgi:hypothetical protein
MSGGTLIASSTYNGGTFTQTGGVSTLGPLSGAGILSVGGGTGTASMTVTQFSQGTITVADLGAFSVLPNSHFDNSVSALSITGSGQLDLANNHIFINYGASADPKASVVAWIKSGFASGSWNGAGIISTSAQANSVRYGLGYADSTDVGNPAGLNASGQIEIKFTYLGDTNLDGKVNTADFMAMASNFGKTGKLWSDGDFNYDGVVNALDFNALATNFGSPTISATAVLGTYVPEPASVVALAGVGLLSYRRRRSSRG